MQPQITCTLLIPSELIPALDRLREQNRVGDMVAALARTVPATGYPARTGKRFTAKYQSPSSFRRVSFRIRRESWHEFSCLARYLSVSRCLAFSILLRRYLRESLKRPQPLEFRPVKILGYSEIRGNGTVRVRLQRSRGRASFRHPLRSELA